MQHCSIATLYISKCYMSESEKKVFNYIKLTDIKKTSNIKYMTQDSGLYLIKLSTKPDRGDGLPVVI